MEVLVVRSEHGIIMAQIFDRAGMIDVLQAVIKDLATSECDEHTADNKLSLYSQQDVLAKLKSVLALHNAKDAGDTKNVDMKKLQIEVNNCCKIDCSNCALNDIVDSYGLFENKNKALLDGVIKKIELIPLGKFRSVKLSADIIIDIIKTTIEERISK